MPAAHVDPVFAEVVRTIYGDEADPREVLEKFSPGGPELHVDGAGQSAPLTPDQQAKKIKRQRVVAATGLASSGVAMVAGADAMRQSVGEARRRHAEAKAAEAGESLVHEAPKAGKVAQGLKRMGVKPVIAAGLISGGVLGLHGVEAVGDTLGAHAQLKQLKQTNKNNPTPQAPQSDLVKAFRLRPVNPMGSRAPSLRARRPRISPTPAPQMFGKKLFQRTRQTVKDVQDTAGSAKKTADQAASAASKINRLIPSRKAALIAGGALAAGTALTTGLGAYAGGRATRKQRPIIIQASPSKARSLQRQVNGQSPVGKSITWTGEISKVDVDKRQVFGWASVSSVGGQPLVDLQGDYVPIDEVEKAAYKYVLESRKGGDMHQRIRKSDDAPLHTADLIESFVVTPEKLEKMGLASNALPLGWWVGMHINDDKQWAMVKSGERTGFSIHGLGQRTPAGISKMTDEEKHHLKQGGVAAAGIGTVMGIRSAPAFAARGAAKVFTNAERAQKMAADMRHAAPAPQMHNLNIFNARQYLAAQGGVVRGLKQTNPDAAKVSPMAERYERTFRESRKIKAAQTQLPGRVKTFLAPTAARRQADSSMMHNLMRDSAHGESPTLYRTMHMTGPGHKVGDKIDFGRASSWSGQKTVADATAGNLDAAKAQFGEAMAHKITGTPPGSSPRMYQREAGHSGLRLGATGKLPQDEWLAGGMHEVTGVPGPGRDYYTVRPVQKAFTDDVKARAQKAKVKLVRTGRRVQRNLKTRVDQAKNPPPVKTRQVYSTAVKEMGYQPQTRRLTYKFYGNSDKDRSYTYRAKPSQGVAAVTAPSKGHYYATKIKGKAKRVEPDQVGPMGRVRLFLDPQVNKALGSPPVSLGVPAVRRAVFRPVGGAV
jgi:hypothetical protein